MNRGKQIDGGREYRVNWESQDQFEYGTRTVAIVGDTGYTIRSMDTCYILIL